MTNNVLYVNDGTYGNKNGYIAPIMQGQYGQTVQIEIRNLTDTVKNLTGYTTITGTLDNRAGTVVPIVGTLSLSATPSAAPNLSWVIDEDDAGTDGLFSVVLSISNGTITYETLPVGLTIVPNPAANATGSPPLVGVSTAQKALLASLMTLTGLANFDGAGAASVIKIKLDGTTAPTVNDDSGDGYGVMSIWVDITNDNIYICTDATLGAANWEQVNGGGAGSVAWGDITGDVADQEDLALWLDGKQNLDTDLTAIAALAPSNDDIIQRKAGAWTARTVAQYVTDILAGWAAHITTFLQSADAAAARSAIGALPEDAGIVTVSSGRDLASTDAGKILECSGTFSMTCPNGLDAGFQCTLVNVGAGTITIAAATTLQSDGTQLTTQYTGATVYHRGSNVWLAMGRLT